MKCDSKFCTKLVMGVIAGNATPGSLQEAMSLEAARAAQLQKSPVIIARLHCCGCRVGKSFPDARLAVCAESIARWGCRLLVTATQKTLHPALHSAHMYFPPVAVWIDDVSFRLGTGGAVCSIGIYATMIWSPARCVSFLSRRGWLNLALVDLCVLFNCISQPKFPFTTGSFCMFAINQCQRLRGSSD